ncbi:hypothetical protein, partial [Escherichia coli]|uniref:hypothetical protein n=1 Tax=Escherichia coli TaxID=562 RepID=UPI001CBF3A04
SILYSVQSHFSGAQTIQLNGNGIPESITRSITGVDGNAALNISVPYKTSYTQNILSVESSINIKGGTTAAWRLQIENRPGSSCCCRTPRRICML